MKKLYSIALLLISLSALSQSPYVINYQGVARYSNGDPIVGPIGVSVTIHVGTATGPATLTEQHSVNTNQFGIFELRIGSNTAGGLSNIGWGTNKYFLGVAIDPDGGTNYGAQISNQQFISVPYALYAEKSGGGSTGTLTASPNVTVTSAGTNSFNINVPNYIGGTNVTITPQSGNNYQINVGNTATSVPSGLWTQVTGAAVLTNSLDNVGIGVVSPAAKLEVSANFLSTNNAIAAYAQGGNGVLALTSSTLVSSAAVSAQNSGSGNGVYGSAVSTSATVAGVRGQNLGSGPGVFGMNNTGSSNGSAHGVYGETNAMTNVAAGVLGSNFGMGPGVYGWQGPANGGPGVWGVSNSSVSTGVYGINNSGNAGVMGEITFAASSPSAHGVRGKTVASSSLAAGVFGENQGGGNGVRGQSNSTNINSAGVSGETFGPGSGVHGISNTTGSAVRAQSGTTSTVSLHLDNGHIRSTSNLTVGVVTFSNTAGWTGLTYIKNGCTDVKGIINIGTSATGVSNGEAFEFNVSFNKSYAVPPTVVISGLGNDFVTYNLKAIFNTYFAVKVINKTGGVLTTPQLANMNLTYYVIE
jgi:hypothetical protein